MTAAEMAPLIGKHGHVSWKECMIEVIVVDVKEQWGRIRYEVRPIAGFGRVWVEDVTFPSRMIAAMGAD